MTEVNLNETVNGYRGSIGRLVFKRYKGRTIVGRKPIITKAPTAGQLAQRERFKKAVAFAKSVVANPVRRAFYEPLAKARDISIYSLAVGDFLHMPEFKYIELANYKGQIGDTIEIIVEDDLGMAYVNVAISAQDGTPIESGPAMEDGTGTGNWIYTTTVPVALGTDVFIEATGADHANNKTVISANPSVGQDEE
jgi:hypothetical protein